MILIKTIHIKAIMINTSKKKTPIQFRELNL